MLSLSPRTDLFMFHFPSDILPPEVKDKYREILNREAGVITDPIDYLNESIMGVSLPGVGSVHIEQSQVSHNGNFTEPAHANHYIGTSNPLELIDKEFKVAMRLNQGLYNYFMMYETIFHRISKTSKYTDSGLFTIYILNESGVAISKIELFECSLDAIEGLEFDYTKISRDVLTFELVFKFNNINFDFIDVQQDTIS